MKTYKTYLPVFPGFYNTIFEPDNEEIEIQDINSQRLIKGLDEITYNECNFDYKEYFNQVSEKVTEVIETELKQYFDISIKFEALISPKLYNFSNDSVNIELTIDPKQVISYLSNNSEAFKDYLKDNYTSCSGFISSHSTDFGDWIASLLDPDASVHKMGASLDFVLFNEGFTDEELYNNIVDIPQVYAANYDELIT